MMIILNASKLRLTAQIAHITTAKFLLNYLNILSEHLKIVKKIKKLFFICQCLVTKIKKIV